MPARRKEEGVLRTVRAYLDEAVERSPEEMPINKSVLARVAKTTRVTLNKWVSDEMVRAAQARQRENGRLSPAQKEKRALEDMLAERDRTIATVQEQNRHLLARSNLVEGNARRLGIDPEELLRPLPKPARDLNNAGQKKRA
jgi:hypothetical protein